MSEVPLSCSTYKCDKCAIHYFTISKGFQVHFGTIGRLRVGWLAVRFGDVSQREKMLFSGTDPESYPHSGLRRFFKTVHLNDNP